MLDDLFITVKRLLRPILDRIPSSLPTGMTSFELYVSSLFADYGLPDNPSHRHAIAANIMRLKPEAAKAPRIHFVNVIKRAQAGEVAWAVMQQLERAEAERQEQLKREAKAQDAADALLKAAAGSTPPEAVL